MTGENNTTRSLPVAIIGILAAALNYMYSRTDAGRGGEGSRWRGRDGGGQGGLLAWRRAALTADDICCPMLLMLLLRLIRRTPFDAVQCCQLRHLICQLVQVGRHKRTPTAPLSDNVIIHFSNVQLHVCDMSREL